jgi:hypothetical protein
MTVRTSVKAPPNQKRTKQPKIIAKIRGRLGWILDRPIYGTNQSKKAKTTRTKQANSERKIKTLFFGGCELFKSFRSFISMGFGTFTPILSLYPMRILSGIHWQ